MAGHYLITFIIFSSLGDLLGTVETCTEKSDCAQGLQCSTPLERADK